MTIKELIKKLKQYENDDELSIRLVYDDEPDEGNYWLHNIEISEKGESGYPYGEIRLIGGQWWELSDQYYLL